MNEVAPEESMIVAAYRARTPGSAALAREAREHFPSGLTHDARRLLPHHPFVARAEGARKWDVDGNEYVDYTGGHGALLLGHRPPKVIAAIAAQLERGMHYGAGHELEIRWATLIGDLIPSAERVRFTASGTEATLLALRLARAFTAKPKFIRFAGHFHGWQDHMTTGHTAHFNGSPAIGILPGIAENVLIAADDDIADVQRLLDIHDDVAAVIIEPTGASWGRTPVTKAFVDALREATRARGAVLIFDEVISGFRASPGGVQGEYGIIPDLTVLAKVMAGGLPGGAVVGRKDIMDGLDFEASHAAGREKIQHQGTHNANPLSAAAGIATLEIVAEGEVCARANHSAAELRGALNRVLADEEVPWAVYGTFSGFHIFTNPQGRAVSPAQFDPTQWDHAELRRNDPDVLTALRLGMLVHGVDLTLWPGGPVSAAHTGDDIAHTAEALRLTVRMMREDGYLAR